ncbi:hypothetical protein GlitD10_2436 [Gloeomargarita lithophora Alchichica-D10]|uniref:Uncharacterized protein n=2 Tax=Gloeomargarita TaxID=1188227 RepID=A0A1J0AFQ7_9CYAN|nr:hypothetical protein GlitD10_2436 [Gloeomargarita lithophora Alchichica-D10]
MTVSYLHDSLEQLAEAILQLESGQAEAAVIFMSEPGEHHFVLRQVGGNDVAVEVRWFDDWASWDIYPSDQYLVAAAGTAPFSVVKEQVIMALERILAQHGVQGYKELWVEHEFPVALYERLKHTKLDR